MFIERRPLRLCPRNRKYPILFLQLKICTVTGKRRPQLPAVFILSNFWDDLFAKGMLSRLRRFSQTVDMEDAIAEFEFTEFKGINDDTNKIKKDTFFIMYFSISCRAIRSSFCWYEKSSREKTFLWSQSVDKSADDTSWQTVLFCLLFRDIAIALYISCSRISQWRTCDLTNYNYEHGMAIQYKKSQLVPISEGICLSLPEISGLEGQISPSIRIKQFQEKHVPEIKRKTGFEPTLTWNEPLFTVSLQLWWCQEKTSSRQRSHLGS